MIYLYKTRPSDTAVALLKSGVIRRIRRLSKPRLVLNFGSVRPLVHFNGRYLNHPDAVNNASCKISTFQILTKAGLSCVPWTQEKDEAAAWQADKKMVVARTLTRGSEGRGAVFLEPTDNLIDAPLYTQYIKKKAEFRVNVAFGEVINIRQKKRRLDFEGEVNNLCRSHSNGWVFCSEGVNKNDPILIDLALRSINALGLDFGAVDILYNSHYNQYFILEVNSAPGMEGETLTNFINALKKVK